MRVALGDLMRHWAGTARASARKRVAWDMLMQASGLTHVGPVDRHMSALYAPSLRVTQVYPLDIRQKNPLSGFGLLGLPLPLSTRTCTPEKNF
jgi:hypothetical protein